MSDLIDLLKILGLEQYTARFLENEIDISLLSELSDQDLQDLGMGPMGHRRKLMRAVAEMGQDLRPSGDTPTRDVASSLSPAPNAAKEGKAERRHLTVTFCDLVGSTALAARLDPEDMREVVRAYQGACAQVIGTYEGFLAQYLGDGVMAYFGYPQAHEDDAERAVRAGLDLIVAVAKLDMKTKVEVRVGIATGLVVVGDLIGEHAAKERAVTGETPNLAARLQGLASPGSVVVAAATRRLLGAMFDLRDLGAQSVRGLDTPVQAFAVTGVRSFESRFEARAGGLTGFVGREEEGEHLLQRKKLAWQGRGQVVLVSGEAGIGKSRLTAWLVDKIGAEPHTRLRYQCTPHHKDSTLYPAIAQLERASGIDANEAADGKFAKLEALLALAKLEPGETVPLFAALLAIPCGDKYPPLAMSPGQQRQRTMAAMLDQIEGLARQKPLLMIYEDAHWADATSLELLDTLVDRVARLPVLVVVTGRPEFSPAWAGRRNVSTLSLQKLDRRHARAMVESVTGGAALPTEVLDQIVAKTDGVPLFVEELTKTVLESGALVEEGQRFHAAGPLPAFAIPATLQDSLMARLDRSNPVKEIAQIGAAIGREFSYKLLLAVAGMDEASIRTALAKLEESELATRRGVPPDATYTFKHALVQDAAYESLLRSRRQVIHRRIAKALRDQFPVIGETEPEIIAHHFAQADRTEQAVEWWTRAGKRALARSAYTEAIRHFEKALVAVSPVPATGSLRLALQVSLAHALTAKYGFGSLAVWDAFKKATQMSETSDSIDFLVAQHGLFASFLVRGEAHDAISQAEIFNSFLKRSNNNSIRIIGSFVRGASRWLAGNFVEAKNYLKIVLDSSDLLKNIPFPLDEIETSAIRFLAFTLLSLGDARLARQAADSLIPRTRSMQNSRMHNLARNYFHLGVFETLRGDARRTRELMSVVLGLGREHDLPIWRTYGSMLLGWAMWRDGDEVDGLHIMQRSRDHFNAHNTTLYLEPFLEGLWASVIASKSSKAAIDHVTQILDRTAVTGQCWYDAELHRFRSNCARGLAGSNGFGEQELYTALRVSRAQTARTFELRASLDLARLYCDTGREREARDLLAPALVGFTETPELPEIGEARRLLAALQ